MKEFNYSSRQYGCRHIPLRLMKKVSKVYVAKQMNELPLKAQSQQKFKDTHHNKPVVAGLINQNLTAVLSDKKYVKNITYIRIREGWLYLCIILDLCSKKVFGWSLRQLMKAVLGVRSIRMVAGKGLNLKGCCIFHSDGGSQYCGKKVVNSLQNYGMRQSIARTGCCYDNAVAESFCHTLEIAVAFGKPFKSLSEASLYIFESIEIFYSILTRPRSGLNYCSPAEFELLCCNEKVRNCA